MLLGAILAALAAGPARAGDPAVVRARFGDSRQARTSGTVFFLAVDDDVGVAAVGAAHSFDLEVLSRAPEVILERGRRAVSVSSRFLVAPGRSFREPGATLRDDFVVFALDQKPLGVRVLDADPRPLPDPDERVELLGIAHPDAGDEDTLYGSVIRAGPERIEIELDLVSDLRGWGGAPVVSRRGGEVVGLLQAAWTEGSTLRVAASPIDAVRAALRRPLDAGRGLPFSAFAGRHGGAPVVARAPEPPPAPPPAPRAPPPPKRQRIKPPEPRASAPIRTPSEPVALLGEAEPPELRIQLEIEHPVEGAVLGDPTGGFLAGRALALFGDLELFDVILVLDTSGSTNLPSGADINGNGIVGEAPMGAVGGLFGLGSSDAGDSILAAEVAAAQRLLDSLDPRTTRVGLVTFAGEPIESARGGLYPQRVRNAALTETPLTSDYDRVRESLGRILDRGADGMTHMAAGVDQATIELMGLRGSLSKANRDSEKFVLFLTDGQPTLPYAGMDSGNVRAVLRAADRARRVGIRIHSFAIGPEALDGPIAPVELAARTQGTFTPVRNPGDIVAVVEAVKLANVEQLYVYNRTAEQEAEFVLISPDGSWSALVPLVPGANEIEVVARAGDGTEARAERRLVFVDGAASPVVPPRLAGVRNRLLERKLIELRRGRLEAEREAADRARKEVLLEIEQERTKARERAERQRKELELEVERDEP